MSSLDTEQLLLALEHLGTALRLLDQSGAPAQIGAHLDLAIHQLQDALATAGPKVTHQAIETNAEPQ